MFDSNSFETPSVGMPPTPEQETETDGEKMQKITEFLKEKIEDPKSAWTGMMADAWENDAWEVLAHALEEEGLGTFAPEELKEKVTLLGDPSLFKKAAELMLNADEQDVDVSDLDKAA